jgi:hypothetical protein
MGYGEFGGNGSVIWRVIHGDGHDGHGDGTGGWGHDKKPTRAQNGRFKVIVNGVQLANVDVNTSRIVILWDGHTEADVLKAGDENVAMEHPAPERKP